MSLTMHLVRHGESVASREHRFCGQMECELTADGRQMAEYVAARVLAAGQWRAVASSPLGRAVETARPSATALGLAVETREGLREIAHGAWEGLSVEEARSLNPLVFDRFQEHPALTSAPGGESGYAVAARALAVVEELRARFGHGDILVVSHKATIRVVVCALLGMDIDFYRLRLAMPVASFTVIEFAATGPILRAFADMSHLPEDLRRTGGI